MLNKEKLNANTVGTAAHSNPQTNKTTKFDCRGGHLCPPANKQNGITLIALIITIIVMLILVGVTVNVAIQGGIFEKAKNAKEQTQVRTNEEALYAAAVGAYDEISGKVNFTKLDEEATKLGFTVKSSGVYEKDGYTYTVNETTGIVTATKITSGGGGGSSSGVADDLATYILGTGRVGRVFLGTNGILNMETMIFEQDPLDPTSTVYNDVKFSHAEGIAEAEGEEEYVFIRYGRDVYKFAISPILDNGDIIGFSSVKNSLTKVNTPTGHVGQYVTYGGIDYIVMSEDETNGTVELISAEALGTVQLGYNDTNAISNATDLNSDGTISDGEKGLYSYNNAVNTLVTACKNVTGLTVDGTNVISIRSVGNKNVKYTSSGITGTDAPGNYTYDWETAGAESDWYTTQGFNSYNMKTEDSHYSEDETVMKQLGIFVADGYAKYWLASRHVTAYSDRVVFNVRCIGGDSDALGEMLNDDCLDDYSLFRVMSTGDTNGDGEVYAVRPVVSLKTSLLNWE